MSLAEFYKLYSKQIENLIKPHNQMWCIGFNNGVYTKVCNLPKHENTSHCAIDYDVGYNEGYSFACYKHFLNEESSEKQKETPLNKNIIVGFIVQNYDCIKNKKSTLSMRNLDLISRLYPTYNSIGSLQIPYEGYLSAERSKILSMMHYLEKIDKKK